MNANEMFPSKWLKAADLKGRTVKVTIASCVQEDIGKGEVKPCLYFLGKDKGIILNKTNTGNCLMAFGPETDNWHGKKVLLTTQFYPKFSTSGFIVQPLQDDQGKPFNDDIPW